MQRILGEEYAAFSNSFEQPRRHGLRVNTGKISPGELLEALPFQLEPVPWAEGGFFYDGADQPARHPYYYAGLYYLQEPSAMTPAAVLPVEKGDRVLDLCAAPGGKATALAAALGGTGLLMANDISASRCRALLKNLELFGTSNMIVTNAVPARLAEQLPGWFDKVLLDAPCSGEGMFRKDEGAVRAWDPGKPAACAAVQKDLVLQAADMLRPGGRMVYSTCTFSPEENEEVIRYLLRERPQMELLPIEKKNGFAPGLGEDMEACARLWPHRVAGEGHFIALLGKRAGGPAGTCSVPESTGMAYTKRKGKKQQYTGRAAKAQETGAAAAFLSRAALPETAGSLRMETAGTQVFARCAGAPALSGIPVLRSGLLLGENKKDRFEPSQALAMALPRGAWPDRAELSAQDERIGRYLRGETLEIGPGDLTGSAEGWQLVCVDGHALGWGRLVRGLLKNKYLPGWRLQS